VDITLSREDRLARRRAEVSRFLGMIRRNRNDIGAWLMLANLDR
jgi:hypothetical protein